VPVDDTKVAYDSFGFESTIKDAVSPAGFCFNSSQSSFGELFAVHEEVMPVGFDFENSLFEAPTSMEFPTTVQSFDLKTPGFLGVGLVDSDSNESTSEKDDDDDEDSAYPPSMIEEVQFPHFVASIRPALLKLPTEIRIEVFNRLESFFCNWLENKGPVQHAPSEQTSPSSASPPSRSQSGSNQTSNPTSDSSGKVSSAVPGSAPKKNNDERPKKRRKRELSSYADSLTGPQWACPFYRREPYRYCVVTRFGDFRKCAKSPGFSSPHRVK
jgi:hypothetical protein